MQAGLYANTMPFYVGISVPTYFGIWEILELTLFFFLNVSVHICAHAVELLGVWWGGASGQYLDMVSR